MTRMVFAAGVLVVLGAALSSGAAGETHAYLWDPVVGKIDLGVLPGFTHSGAVDVNDAGQVVGGCGRPYGPSRPFIWDEINGMRDLQEITGLSVVSGIGNAGHICGEPEFPPYSLAVWDPVSGIYVVAHYESHGEIDVNDGGEVAGYHKFWGWLSFPFFWSPVSGYRYLSLGPVLYGAYPFRTFAEKLNNRGDVIGYAYYLSQTVQADRALVWKSDGTVIAPDLLPGCTDGYTEDINDLGQVVGGCWGPGVSYSFLWDEVHGTQDLAVLGCPVGPVAINNAGQIAGMRQGRACVWDPAAGVRDIGTFGGEWIEVAEMNNLGQVAGSYDYVRLTINIDIKPGSDKNTINLGSRGVVPVAVLTTESFDAAEVDPDTISFAEARPVRWHLEDVDSDGDRDLVCHFRTPELCLTPQSTEAGLTAMTREWQDLEGSDSVTIVGRKK